MATARTTAAPTDFRLTRLFAAGATDQAIAEHIELSPWTVRAHRQRLGLLRRPPPGPPIAEDDLVRLHGEGLVTSEIARRLGCTLRTAQEYLYRLGLQANR